jgi:hypothetical protein
MPPTPVGLVLRLGVLAIVDQQRRVAGQAIPRDPRCLVGGDVLAETGLVVGQVADARAGLGQTVAERRSAMGDERGPELDVTYAPGRRRGVLERDPGGQLADLDRRQRVGDVTSEALAQRPARARRAPDRRLDPAVESGAKNIRP